MVLQNKNIIVAGGSSGIGLEAVKCFIGQGANLVAIGKNSDENLPHASKQLQWTFGDLRKEDTIQQAIKICIEHYSRIDGLLHVAGGSGRTFGDGPLHELTEEGWEKTIQLNATTTMLTNRAVINVMLHQNISGSIVNVSSVLASHPSPHFFSTHAYAAAKAAIIGLSKSTAAFYAEKNIRINVVSPGLVDTPMATRAKGNSSIMEFIKTKQPLDRGRISRPDDIAGMAAFLLSDQSSFITGQEILIDGGWSISDGQYK
jgi:NAD(P)-dependent dehydrogenase (short-subunit alcohol dehydrogenase family)